MNFPFQELAPTFPLALLFLLAVISLFVSWWSYRNLQSLSNSIRVLLISLRATVLLLIIVLLLNPLYQKVVMEDLPPRAVLYLDNSESMSVQKGDYHGIDSYETSLQQLLDSRPEDIELEIFQFGSTLRPVSGPPRPDLEDKSTDYGQVFGHIERNQFDYPAAILFTDGIVTRGRDPVFQSRRLPVPVYTIPVGDPNPAIDLQIRDVQYRSQAPLNSEQTIRVDLFQSGFMNDSATLKFFRNGELQEERIIQFEESVRLEEEFRLIHETEQVEELTFELEPQVGELREENNSYTVHVDVRDQRLTVLHLSYRIHPDTGYLRRLLQRNSRVELETYTWISNRYIEGTLSDTTDNMVDLIIVDGQPPEAAREALSIFRDTPTVHIYSDDENPPTTVSGLSRIPVDTSGSVRGRPSVTVQTHPISDIGLEATNRLPLLSGPRPGRDVSGYTETVLTYEDSEAPLLLVEETGSARKAHLFASGWYRYSLSPVESTRDFSERLLSNLIYWTAASSSRGLMELTVTPEDVRAGEPVLFRSEINRQTEYRGSDVSVYLTLLGPEDESQRFRMSETATDQFELELTDLSPGTYRYTASLQMEDGPEIETEIQGTLIVQPLSEEWLQTARNDSLLALISRQTDGQIVSTDRLTDLWDRLRETVSETTSIQRTESWSPIHSPLWLAIIILVLLAEWIIRKYHSLP